MVLSLFALIDQTFCTLFLKQVLHGPSLVCHATQVHILTGTKLSFCRERSAGHLLLLSYRVYCSIWSTVGRTKCLSLSRYVRSACQHISFFASLLLIVFHPYVNRHLPSWILCQLIWYEWRLLGCYVWPLIIVDTGGFIFLVQIRSGQSNSTVQCVTQSGERFIKHIQIADRNNILWTIVQAMLRKLQCCENFIQPRSLSGRCTKCKGASVSNSGGKRTSIKGCRRVAKWQVGGGFFCYFPVLYMNVCCLGMFLSEFGLFFYWMSWIETNVFPSSVICLKRRNCIRWCFNSCVRRWAPFLVLVWFDNLVKDNRLVVLFHNLIASAAV